jgi:hypothetical protein
MTWLPLFVNWALGPESYVQRRAREVGSGNQGRPFLLAVSHRLLDFKKACKGFLKRKRLAKQVAATVKKPAGVFKGKSKLQSKLLQES